MSTKSPAQGESLKTRSEAAGSALSSKSSVRRRAQLSRLRAEQARKAADAETERARRAAETQARAAETQARALEAQAQATAQLTIDEARAEAQKASDQAEVDELELQLIEEEENGSQKLDAEEERQATANPIQHSSGQDAQRQSPVFDRRRDFEDAQRQFGRSPTFDRRRDVGDPQRQPARPTTPAQRGPQLPARGSEVDTRERTRGWIRDLPSGTHAARDNAALPKVTLEKFDGSPLEWPRWSALFRTLVHDNRSLTDTERMVHLQSCLTGEAREAVRGLLCDGSLYQEALNELEMQFGDATVVVDSTLSSVLQHPPVKQNDLSSLTHLSRALHAAVSVLTAMNFRGDLTATTNLRQVIAKLPTSLAWQWGQREMELLPYVPTLTDVDLWLKGIVLAGRRALPGLSKREPGTAQVKPTSASQMSSQHRGRAPFRTAVDTQRTTLATSTGPQEPSKCKVCTRGVHQLDQCSVLLAMSPEERFQLVRDSRRCFRCLSEAHWSKACKSKLVCGENGCKGKHHRLLHVTAPTQPRSEEPAPAVADNPRQVMATALQAAASKATLLQIVPVRIHGASGSYRDTHALLDSGADTSLCVEHALQDLSVTGPREELRLNNVEGSGENKLSMRVTLQVSPLSPDGGTETVTVPEVFAVPRLNVRPTAVDWSQRDKWTHLADIEIPDTNGKQVELLLGANVLEAVLQKEARVGKPGEPVAIKTHFGWCLTGSVSNLLPVGTREVMHVIRSRSTEDELTDMMQDWWTTEAFGTTHNMSQPRSFEDRQAEMLMEKTTQWREDRYETGLLWRAEDVTLPNNYAMALRRLEATERALQRAPDKAAAYCQTMEEYVRNGFARKVSPEGQTRHERSWQLPHHAVTNKPGKFRVVFDAAATYGGTSLNENLLTGPDLLKTIPGVLMRFRQESVALTADIEKMFLQIAVRAEDQPSLRFLWRNLESDRPPDVYQMDRVIFGARSSPASASFVLNRTAEEKCTDTAAGRAAAATVRDNFYMDDLATSEMNSAAALQTATEVTTLVSRGGFRLRKWLSNSKEVLAAIPTEERAPRAADLRAPLPEEKVLGVMWNAQLDVMYPSVPPATATSATKRDVLRVVASIFDPLGLASPFVLIAKLILQELWSRQQGWDADLPEEECDKWTAWLSELPKLRDVRVPRWYGAQEEVAITRQLHIFCDASESAFGAAVYLRQVYPDGQIHCALVMSKCRVAPLKKLSIVRLETQAAVLAVRLAACVKEALTLEVNNTVFWSDSQVVLSYIANDSKRFHTFIANRVAEIRDLTEPRQWRHVPGQVNPSDDCSRGLMASALTSDSRWIRGPAFLWLPEEDWPSDDRQRLLEDGDPETKTVLATRASQQTQPPTLPDVERFSSWTRYKRTVGWIRRFLTNFAAAHTPAGRLPSLRGPLSAQELQDAEAVIISKTQQEAYAQEIAALRRGEPIGVSSRLQSLSPYLDRTGLLRVGGRLSNAPVPEETRHPIILPRDSRVATLIVTATHEKLMHAGADHVLNELRQMYWIPRARAAVRQVVHDCPACQRRRARPCQPRMADLPAARFDTRHAFSSVGIDYFGPLMVKTSSRRPEKRYCLLVTCMATRAVHLEVSHSLTTDSFLMAFRRYVSKRSRPLEVFSDNGTNLRAGEKELRQLLREWNQRVICDQLSQDNIKWHFNPPASSDMGGVWESMIATVKRALRTVLGKLIVTDEVLLTVIAEAEAVVNSRPLTHVSTQADSLEALTPNHVLLGRAVSCLPPGLFDDGDVSSRRIWRQTQALADQFWRRWLREYVPGLACRSKWTRETRNLAPGDLILLTEEDVPRGHWPLGRVTEVFPGPDGRVRSARVRVRGGIVHRPARKICVLEEAATS